MGYSIVLLPLWLLQVAGVLTAVASIVIAALTDEPRALAGLIAAGILFGLPKLWIDDAHHVVREALGELPPVDALVAPPRSATPQHVRVATEPEDTLEEPESAPRRGDRRERGD